MRKRIIATIATLAAVAGIILTGAGTASAACMGDNTDDLTHKACTI